MYKTVTKKCLRLAFYLHCPSSHNRRTDMTKKQYTSTFCNFVLNLSVSAILEDIGHCQNMSIADTGRFWEILVIPVLQILEDSGKYWYCRYWKILENTGYTSITDTGRLGCGMYLYIVFFVLSVRLL